MLGHTTECNRSSIVTKDPREVEANQFAAELLTPLELLKQAILKLKTVDELAKGFWVSKDSMSWRVLETGLYNRLTSWE
jgi:Zn-dependent peptidase ImmA (M78 family)